MPHLNRLLRISLGFQGCFYLATSLWALLATRHFLNQNNPGGDIFEARAFAALSGVLAIFFLAGVWRKDLLRPAAFLGLGTSAALVLVELFHLPAIGLTYLWIDLLIEVALAGFYIYLFFFWEEKEVTPTEVPTAEKNSAEEDPSHMTPDVVVEETVAATEPVGESLEMANEQEMGE